ncbi:sigma-70 family RNA polymerase sigma factor [bacterium]|nr:sigma-70 family RNA polymerase sigma factor [bacterium]
MGEKIFSEDEYNQAYRYSISLCGDQDEAFDLLQTSFEKLLKKGVKELDNPKQYLYRIIRNQFIDNYRKNKNWKFNEFNEESNIIHLNSDRFDDVLATEDEVAQLMKSISPSERELLYLSAVEGYSITEMSELSGTPRGTLLSKLHRLKMRIKKQFPNNSAEQAG